MVEIIYIGPANRWSVIINGKVVFTGDYRDAYTYYEYYTMFPNEVVKAA